MTLQEIRYFCVTAEVLHYTRAANLLYISQPSLSYAIAKLEKALGVPLFEKHGKQVTLSKYGEAFLPYAQNVLRELSEGMHSINELKQPAAGIINLGYIYSVSFSVLPEFVNKYYDYQRGNQIGFRFHQGMAGALIEQLFNGDLDILIAGMTDEPDIASIEHLPIYSQELFLAVPANHPLAGKDSVTLDDLRGENFVSLNHDTVIYHQLEDRFKKADITPNTVFEADEYSSIAASIATGAGIAIMPILPILETFNIKMIPFSDTDMSRKVCIIRNSSKEMSEPLKDIWTFAEELSKEAGLWPYSSSSSSST